MPTKLFALEIRLLSVYEEIPSNITSCGAGCTIVIVSTDLDIDVSDIRIDTRITGLSAATRLFENTRAADRSDRAEYEYSRPDTIRA